MSATQVRNTVPDQNPVLPTIETVINRTDSYTSLVPDISSTVMSSDDEGAIVWGEYVGVDAGGVYELAEEFTEQYMAGEVDMPEWDEDFLPVYLPIDAPVKDKIDFLCFGNLTNAYFWEFSPADEPDYGAWIEQLEQDTADYETGDWENPDNEILSDDELRHTMGLQEEQPNGGKQTLAYANDYLGTEWSGAMAHWAGFKKLWEEEIRDSDTSFADWFADVDSVQMQEYWGDIPMAASRIEVFKDAAKKLKDRYDGPEYGASFATLVDDADGKLYDHGDGIIDQLVREFNGYKDFREHDGHIVWLDKQVQLAGNMLYLNLMNDDRLDITMENELQVFPNYRLPQMMHDNGVLMYGAPLPHALDTNDEIEGRSRLEWETRMLTVVAGRLVQNTANHLLPDGEELTTSELDNLMFQTGRGMPRDTQRDDADGTLVRGHFKVPGLDY